MCKTPVTLQRCAMVLMDINCLRERHNLNHNKCGPSIEQGDVLIQNDERNRG